MLIRSALLAAVIVFAMAGPAVAQTSASGRATLVVGELMTLKVVGPVASGATANLPGQASAPVRVEVAANRSWQLTAVLDGKDGRSWSAGAVARGGAGRTPVELDYDALLDAAGAAPGATLRLTLSAL